MATKATKSTKATKTAKTTKKATAAEKEELRKFIENVNKKDTRRNGKKIEFSFANRKR